MDSASVTGSSLSPTSSTSLAAWTGPGLEHWDLIVVGTDVAGLESALNAADFRGRVGLVEQRSAVSGASIAPSSGTSARLDSPKSQIVRLPGWAVFTGPHTIAVHGREVAFHRAILATGARWDATVVSGLAETGFVTPETLSAIHQPVRQVAVLGSGARACEVAQTLRRLGSEVHLVAQAADLLEGDEPLAVQAVRRALEADGVKLHLGFRAMTAEVAGRAKALVIERDAARHKLLVDEIVLAGERRANLERLGIEAAGIQVLSKDSRQVVEVDSRLATNNARVFAVGGIAAPEACVEALERMCRVAIQNAIGSARHRFDPLLVPRVVSTVPQIAQIGATRANAQSRELDIESWLLTITSAETVPFRIDATDDLVGVPAVEPSGSYAIVHLLRDIPGRIAGATLIGPHAAEAIGTVALLMAEELPLASLIAPVTPAATFARALSRLGETIAHSRRSSTRRAR